jgi:hypothetical protein
MVTEAIFGPNVTIMETAPKQKATAKMIALHILRASYFKLMILAHAENSIHFLSQLLC